MTVLTLDPESKTPIYLQIVQEMKTLVMTGKLHPHEQIPSVRKNSKISPSIPTPCKGLRSFGARGDPYLTGSYFVAGLPCIKEMRKQEIREMFQRVTRGSADRPVGRSKILRSWWDLKVGFRCYSNPIHPKRRGHAENARAALRRFSFEGQWAQNQDIKSRFIGKRLFAEYFLYFYFLFF